jgi:hypothetical protein
MTLPASVVVGHETGTEVFVFLDAIVSLSASQMVALERERTADECHDVLTFSTIRPGWCFPTRPKW